ncbi:RNase adapter RapZ [Wenzhouxiangella sp. C33]|uniref:RNase adapter RapZ n=2 Tax=Wenzhouxiangella limi TaxID=2707351 RepID=A0A845UW84_9GAMM|nr:RNase adapter RapZ [Wenzhouxiangella limi]
MTDGAAPMVVITGMSGSGKSLALNALEDLGYYCVDNLPGGLLAGLVAETRSRPERYPRVAIGIDARTGDDGLERLVGLLDGLPHPSEFRLLFLEAQTAVIARRFSETRRRHPLADVGGLETAIADERRLLAPLRERADWIIDTSETNIHQLRRQVLRQVGQGDFGGIQTLVLESFGFKNGVPLDVDFVFDARCLPNPHWIAELRPRTGLDSEVRDWLESHDRVEAFHDDVLGFIQRWLPALAEDQRSLLTIAIGCTGGQHRSVYLVDRMATAMAANARRVIVSHRELER